MQEPEKVAVNGENYIIHCNYRVLGNIPLYKQVLNLLALW